MNKPDFLRRSAAVLKVLLTTVISLPLMADTLELADGSILEGVFVGSSNVPRGTLLETTLRTPLVFQ